MDWLGQIRTAYDRHRKNTTAYRVAADTGIRVSRLQDFEQGKGLSAANMQILGEYLGFSLSRTAKKNISENG